jgi:predicted CXXCH cytochrome family protein
MKRAADTRPTEPAPTLLPRRTMHMARIVLVLLALAATVACERIVYITPGLLDDLPVGAGGFVGYTSVDAGLTVCGNCHVTQQNQWARTSHANAFGAAVSLAPSQAEVCAVCHAVSLFGNDAQAPGGWPATRDTRYHDVQCESCHGPGETHVRNPDGGTANQVLARVNAGLGMDGTCAECHSGFHHPFVQEWAASGHGRVLAAPAGRADCAGCHEGKAALRAFGVLAEYREQNEPDHIAITCAVCHDPHRNAHAGQLRFSLSVPDEQLNLCMRCHNKRGGPDFAAQNRGPHSPEGPMLLGEAGWWPPNMPIQPGSRIVGTHGSQANPRMCAGCHMQQIEVTDRATGLFVLTTTGHMFEAIPCVDEQGRPTGVQNCSLQQRTFRTCTGAGCHGSENAVRSVTITVTQRINSWNNQLKALLARVPATEFNPNDSRYSTAEGARFNSQLADRPGSVSHNPFLLEALLIASIQQVQRDYGLTSATAAAELQAHLERALGTRVMSGGADGRR